MYVDWSDLPAGARVARIYGQRALQFSENVVAIQYRNSGSSRATPYEHAFEHAGVQMWGLTDGGILIRHPTLPVWALYDVRDTE